MSAPPSLIGTTLGAYDIQAVLGSGGMATVYRGLDRNLLRDVAVKVLSPALTADPAFIDRFRHEGRVIASLTHPHIARVYTFGEHNGAPYIVQEFLPGPTLQQQLADLASQDQRMAQQDVLAIVAQIASALDAAHAVGIIHRDIKPGNLLYNNQGQLVLTDFGIARSTADTARMATAAGVVMGTPGYVAPEQAISSASLTPACDVYALGVVVFEILCGQLPFTGATAMDVVLKHLYDQPPAPTSLRPDLPSAVDAVVLKALNKEPTARFDSAGALAQALAAAWPVAAPAPPDVHNLPTDVWAVPRSAAAPAPSATSRPTPAPASARSMTRLLGRSQLLLPLLALVLCGALGAGAVLTWRNQTQPTGAATAAPTRIDATAPAAQITAVPTPQNAAAPAPALPTDVPAVPTDVPATAADPLANLRTILTNAIDAGQGKEKDGRDLLKQLDEVERALTKGDQEKAGEQLSKLREQVSEQAEKGTIDATLAAQALTSIDQLAAAYGLES